MSEPRLPALGVKPPARPRSARPVFLISVAVTGLLYLVPYGNVVAYPLLLLSTLVHELGHGLSALLVGGSFESFRMWQDGSGVAMHAGNYSALGRAVISAGGLVGPALAAALGFTVSRRPGGARAFLLVLGLGLGVAEILVVEESFGLIFVGVAAAASLLIAAAMPAGVAQVAVIFLSVQLALSVFSRADYLFTPYARTAGGTMPSDVQQMADALGGPYWLWGGMCAAISVAALLVGAVALLRGRS